MIDVDCMMVVHLQSPGVPRTVFDLGFANVDNEETTGGTSGATVLLATGWTRRR